MKFIVCRDCHDTVTLNRTTRRCTCGASAGRYTDDIKAEITGPATAFGIDSFGIGLWLRNTRENHYPKPYEGTIQAWCMPRSTDNIEYVDSIPD